MALEFTDVTAKEAIDSGEIVVIDFYADWCSPCKMVGPVIEKLAEKYVDTVKIGKMNVDNNSTLPSQYGIRNIPTVVFIKNGNVVDKQVGVAQESVYDQKINDLITN